MCTLALYVIACGMQTLLEQLKGMFGKKAGIPLDKIPPTVGLNSTFIWLSGRSFPCRPN